jgi:hypothetical protein
MGNVASGHHGGHAHNHAHDDDGHHAAKVSKGFSVFPFYTNAYRPDRVPLIHVCIKWL